jgi:hypothetical protein
MGWRIHLSFLTSSILSLIRHLITSHSFALAYLKVRIAIDMEAAQKALDRSPQRSDSKQSPAHDQSEATSIQLPSVLPFASPSLPRGWESPERLLHVNRATRSPLLVFERQPSNAEDVFSQ